MLLFYLPHIVINQRRAESFWISQVPLYWANQNNLQIINHRFLSIQGTGNLLRLITCWARQLDFLLRWAVIDEDAHIEHLRYNYYCILMSSKLHNMQFQSKILNICSLKQDFSVLLTWLCHLLPYMGWAGPNSTQLELSFCFGVSWFHISYNYRVCPFGLLLKIIF